MNRVENEMQVIPGLPEPGPAAREHSQLLCEYVRGLITREGGSINFARYMDLVLYAPGLGYYSAGARKFGAAGDFVTAPEISPLFSRCLAEQCRQVLAVLDDPVILELGAGSGIMACDLLLELENRQCLPVQYQILEVSADLRERQKANVEQHIPHLASRVMWLDTLPAKGMKGIVLANEVLDAMPVHRFRLQDPGVREMRVVSKAGHFEWEDAPADQLLEKAVREALETLDPLPSGGYTSEINLGLRPWIQSLADVLAMGAMLFIDYGYPAREFFHPQRTDGTLLCHYRHRVHDDPFLFPGLQDITASVNFTQVADAAVDAGLTVCGYTTQAYFLIACGLEELMTGFEQMETKQRLELSRQVKILTLPVEMGERFKVMALTRGIDMPLRGFSLVDHRSHL